MGGMKRNWTPHLRTPRPGRPDDWTAVGRVGALAIALGIGGALASIPWAAAADTGQEAGQETSQQAARADAAGRPGAEARSAVRRVAVGSAASAAAAQPAKPQSAAAPALSPQSFNGVGNNLARAEWGSAGVNLLRWAPAAYADGVSTPAGATRPSARAISNALSESPEGGIINDRDWTAFTYAWGQFLDHDLSLTATASPRESFPIPVPAGDPSFDPSGTGTATISMSRSTFDPLTGTSATNPRQQVNAITAFIDGSQVYGSDAAQAAALRTFTGGLLKTSEGNLLPFNTAGLPIANDAHVVPDTELFLAGDIRANENPELIAMQTLFVREHNRIAAATAAKNPTWTDEQIYQYARRVVIAELQKITYTEFLPALIGRNTPAAARLLAYSGYKPGVNPGIATEFSTAAFRVGHSMLGEDIEFLDANGDAVRDPLALRDAFFNAPVVSETGIEPILKYLASSRAQEIDTMVVEDVRSFLFGQPGQGGFDLAALNIQRGRDHGLADYNTVRAAYGLPKVTSFADITPDEATQATLADLYGSVDNLDLWVAGLAEKHLPGSSLGPTFTAIIVDQFRRLRDGDRYWYQNKGVLPAAVLREVQSTTLADIIRRNTTLSNVQSDVFFLKVAIGGNVFTDANNDGRRQGGEAAVAKVPVSLLAADGTVVATTTTDKRGGYLFTGLDLGDFRAVVTTAGGGVAPESRVVSITRGMAVLDNNIAVAPVTT